MANDSLLRKLHEAFSPEEWAYIERKKLNLVLRYVNAHIPNKRNWNFEPTDDDIKSALEGKNLTVMYGGGKDSGVMLAGARAMQLMLQAEYGVAPELRVGIGRHPGMVGGVFANVQNALEVLELKNDPSNEPSVDVFWIDHDKTSAYVAEETHIPEEVSRTARKSVLHLGHIFGGAGRRTFCDSCNIHLGQWISAALSYKGGANIFMTGDNVMETTAQINGDVKTIAKQWKVALPQESTLTKTQEALGNLAAVAQKHTEIFYKNEAPKININYLKPPKKTQFLAFFGKSGVSNEIGKRFDFLHEYLKMNHTSLAFSFTESDCGNPALMCHLYGLIVEHAYGHKGATYGDGVRMIVDCLAPVMLQKKFPPEWLEESKQRYQHEAAIQATRRDVEIYAEKTYGLKPQHWVAMVYTPFTGEAQNLPRYLDYLATLPQKPPEADEVIGKAGDIIAMISDNAPLRPEQQRLATALETLTGVDIDEMRNLYQQDLLINNFKPMHHTLAHSQTILLDQDPYTHTAKLAGEDFVTRIR